MFMSKLGAKDLLPVLLAWGAMFAITLPPFIFGFGARFIGAPAVLLLSALTFLWPALRALRGSMLALLALVTGPLVISLFILQNAAYENWVGTLPIWTQIFLGPQFAVGLRFITVGMLASTLVRSGLKRQDLFLARSDLKAPFQGKPVFRQSVPWWLVGGLLLVVVSGLTTLFLALITRLGPTALPQLLVNLPFILLAGGANTFVEEFGWRSVLLVRSSSVMGPMRANWLQATYFGLTHYYYGTPGGPVGVLMNITLGWLLGKSVLETRGFTVNFVVHIVADAIIFAFFVMAVA